MKRKSTGKPNNDPATQSKSRKKIKSETWTAEQDDFIVAEMSRLSDLNWKAISKRFNKKFARAKRSFLECKSRWLLLTSPENLWSRNEQLVLLLAFYKAPANWPYIASLLPNKAFIKNYFVNKVKKLASGIKSKGVVLDNCSHFKVIKKLFLLKFVWDEFTNKTCSDIMAIIKAAKLKESDCSLLLDSLKGWTKEELNAFLQKFYNSFIDAIIHHSDDSLGELIHPRKEETGRSDVKYCWIPFNVNGRELYLLGRYNI